MKWPILGSPVGLRHRQAGGSNNLPMKLKTSRYLYVPALTLALLLAAPLLRAEDPALAKEKISEKMKEKYDADKDGKLSDEEKAKMKEDAKEKREEVKKEILEKYDANHNGKLDADEKEKMKADRAAEKAAHKAEQEKRKAEREARKA